MTKRRTTRKKGSRRKAAKRRGGKKAFGGYTVNFCGCQHSLEHVFGTKPIPPSAMTKKLWAYVKRNRLNKR